MTQSAVITKKIIKTGNSLYVSIPSKFAKTIGIKPKDESQVVYDLDEREIIIRFPHSRQLPLIKVNS